MNAAIVAAIAVGVLPARGSAQAAPGSLSAAQAVALASTHAPDVLVSQARAAIAAADVRVAGMLTNPTVIAGASLTSGYFYTAFSVSLPVFGQRGAAVAVSEAALEEARRDADVARLDVRYAAALAWDDLWQSEREAESAARTRDRLERLLTATQERFDTGTAPRLDVVRSRAEALRARAEAAASEAHVAAASARLATWVTPQPEAELRAAGDPPAPGTLPPLEELLARAEQNPALVRTRAHEVTAQREVDLERRRRLPLLGLEVGGNFFDPQGGAINDAHVALSFEVPFFHNHGPLVARAVLARTGARVESDAARRRLLAEVVASRAELLAADERARAQVTEVLPAAREAADLAQESYRAGRADVTAVLAAEQALVDAELAAQRAVADRARALAGLEHAVGSSL